MINEKNNSIVLDSGYRVYAKIEKDCDIFIASADFTIDVTEGWFKYIGKGNTKYLALSMLRYKLNSVEKTPTGNQGF